MADSTTSAIRAVVDVNLLVRGILSASGGSALLIRALKQRLFVPIVSRQYLHEIYRVLGYPRLLRRYPVTARQRQRLIAQLYSDPDLDLFLEQRGVRLVRLGAFLTARRDTALLP